MGSFANAGVDVRQGRRNRRAFARAPVHGCRVAEEVAPTGRAPRPDEGIYTTSSENSVLRTRTGRRHSVADLNFRECAQHMQGLLVVLLVIACDAYRTMDYQAAVVFWNNRSL